MWRVALLGFFGALALSCAPSIAYFRPTEKALGESFQGQQQAVYDLSGPGGRVGEVKVWTSGAFRQNDSTLVHVLFDVESTAQSAVELDGANVTLVSVVGEHGSLRNVPPTQVTPPVRVEPGDLSGVSAYFRLPEEMKPGDIEGFVVRWTARVEGQPTTELTPFVRLPYAYESYYYPYYPYYYYPYHWPYYDPFYGPYFGFHFYSPFYLDGGHYDGHHGRHAAPMHPTPAPTPGPTIRPSAPSPTRR